MKFLASLAALIALVAATAAPPPVTLSLHVDRTSFDLLDTLPIEVSVHNPATSLQLLQFDTPVEYVAEIQRDGSTIFSYPPTPAPDATFTPHRRAFGPGPTALVVYDWNEVTHDGWSPLPGPYVVRAKLRAAQAQPEATMRVTFAKPLPPAALASLNLGQDVTIAGTLDETKTILADANGSMLLSRRLLAAKPGVPIVVRGHATAKQDGSRTFTFVRWAPLGPP